jgi:hypothetical protein
MPAATCAAETPCCDAMSSAVSPAVRRAAYFAGDTPKSQDADVSAGMPWKMWKNTCCAR